MFWRHLPLPTRPFKGRKDVWVVLRSGQMMRHFVGIVASLPCLRGICRGVDRAGRNGCTGFAMTTPDDGFSMSCVPDSLQCSAFHSPAPECCE